MSKRVKEMLVDVIRQRIGESRDMLLVDASRIDANTVNRFRLALREKEIQVLAVPNKLGHPSRFPTVPPAL